MKQAKLQRSKSSSQMTVDSMDKAIREASRTFKTKKWEYVKDTINEHETNRTEQKIFLDVF
jgi:hypothetical protein